MDRSTVIKNVTEEIERLTTIHILYGLDQTAVFQKQKEYVSALISDYKINIKAELDPVTRNLYRRYMG